MASSPETDCSELPNQMPCNQTFESFNILDYVHGLNLADPLNMEFAPSGKQPPLELTDSAECTELFTRENTSLSSQELDSPQLPIDPHFQFSTPIPSTPQWPMAPNTFYPLQFGTYSDFNIPLFPSSQVISYDICSNRVGVIY